MSEKMSGMETLLVANGKPNSPKNEALHKRRNKLWILCIILVLMFYFCQSCTTINNQKMALVLKKIEPVQDNEL